MKKTKLKKIVARVKEQKTLEKFFKSSQAEFLAVYGRRRVGKTYLIRHFFTNKDCFFFQTTGIFGEPMETQIKAFTKEIGRTFLKGAELKERDNWYDTFELLLETINKQVEKKEKIVLFLDEFPWMATHRSKLLRALEYYWNRHWSHDERIKLIICGSAASWIMKNIIKNKAGLHNRLSKVIHLEPLNLNETREFLRNQGIKLNQKHITEIYMVTGGIPYYLTHIDEVSSSAQIIEEIAFTKNSFLLKEFDNLYASLFEDAEVYIELVRKIAAKAYGIGQEELFEEIGPSSKGGTTIKKLKELENAGFIISFTPYQRHKKGIYYKVIDEYTLFYFDWIEPIKETLLTRGLQKGYWQQNQQTPAWHNWAGYAFEAICYKHLVQIGKALSLNPASIPYAWRYIPKKGSKEKGAQIDLLFDRNDHAITICEIKYTEDPFVIDKAYAQKLNQKIEVFKKITKQDVQIFIAFVSAMGLKRTMYSEEMVTHPVVRLDDLFVSE